MHVTFSVCPFAHTTIRFYSDTLTVQWQIFTKYFRSYGKKKKTLHRADFELNTSVFLLLHRACCYNYWFYSNSCTYIHFNPLNAELNPICYLLALLGARHLLHVSRIRVKSLTLRQLMSYIYIYIYIYIWSAYSWCF